MVSFGESNIGSLDSATIVVLRGSYAKLCQLKGKGGPLPFRSDG
jgi:hypothetical protein